MKVYLCIVRASPAFGRVLAELKAENSGSRAQHSSTKEYDVIYPKP